MKNQTTNNKVVLITGTRKGIGQYLAHYFVQKGYLVEGMSREKPDWQLDNYYHHLGDVADEGDVKSMLSSISKRHGRLDVAINNAGIASMNHILLTPVATVDKIFATNFRGTFLVCREAAKLMKTSGGGRIVNLTSVAVPLLLQGEAIYAASKSAIETFTKILAFELAEFGITCNAVGPGPVETDLIAGVPDEKIKAVTDRLAIKRLAKLEDVAAAIDYFLAADSNFVTGQITYLGGV